MCIGGAAWTTNVEYGALLVASYPVASLTGWRASSKEHYSADSHTLNVVAIGLKLDGISASTLRSLLYTQTGSAPTSQYPFACAQLINSNRFLVGGGARVINEQSDPGSLLTSSRWHVANTYPCYFPGWGAGSKQHIYTSYVGIMSYAIHMYQGGEPNTLHSFNIPGFGILESVATQSQPIPVNSGYGLATANVPSTYVIACPGGEAYQGWTNPGRMLCNIQVDMSSGYYSMAKTKDHRWAAAGTTYAYNIGLWLKP